MSEITREQVKEYLSSLSILELSKLIKELEEAWGVSASAAMIAAPTIAAAPQEEKKEEKKEEKVQFDVILTSAGQNKLQVIKVVRAITNLGLKEAKDLVDGAPKPIKEAITKEEAEEIKKKIEEVGGTVEIK